MDIFLFEVPKVWEVSIVDDTKKSLLTPLAESEECVFIFKFHYTISGKYFINLAANVCYNVIHFLPRGRTHVHKKRTLRNRNAGITWNHHSKNGRLSWDLEALLPRYPVPGPPKFGKCWYSGLGAQCNLLKPQWSLSEATAPGPGYAREWGHKVRVWTQGTPSPGIVNFQAQGTY